MSDQQQKIMSDHKQQNIMSDHKQLKIEDEKGTNPSKFFWKIN
jgi:hypothetical protein